MKYYTMHAMDTFGDLNVLVDLNYVKRHPELSDEFNYAWMYTSLRQPLPALEDWVPIRFRPSLNMKTRRAPGDFVVNDFCLISENVVRHMGGFLRRFGQFYPIIIVRRDDYEGEPITLRYFIFHCTHILANALNKKHSDGITSFAFHHDRIPENSHIFRFDPDSSVIAVSEQFIERYQECGAVLTGLKLRLEGTSSLDNKASWFSC